ncbi:hypothetical protein XMV208_002229 [Aliiroseovarius sp. xm-v-208]|nr:hypothetical protein [Aliiroseovarius sp. xm-v-208]
MSEVAVINRTRSHQPKFRRRARLTKPITRSDRNKNGNATNQTAKTRTLAPKMVEITDATDALLSVKQRSEFDLSVCGDAQ